MEQARDCSGHRDWFLNEPSEFYAVDIPSLCLSILLVDSYGMAVPRENDQVYNSIFFIQFLINPFFSGATIYDERGTSLALSGVPGTRAGRSDIWFDPIKTQKRI